MAYIELEPLMKDLKEQHDNIMLHPDIDKATKWREALCYNRTIEALKEAPSVDVVEVVRCEQCELFVDNKKALVRYCRRECKNLTVKPTDFCSYGRKKAGVENG